MTFRTTVIKVVSTDRQVYVLPVEFNQELIEIF